MKINYKPKEVPLYPCFKKHKHVTGVAVLFFNKNTGFILESSTTVYPLNKIANLHNAEDDTEWTPINASVTFESN